MAFLPVESMLMMYVLIFWTSGISKYILPGQSVYQETTLWYNGNRQVSRNHHVRYITLFPLWTLSILAMNCTFTPIRLICKSSFVYLVSDWLKNHLIGIRILHRLSKDGISLQMWTLQCWMKKDKSSAYPSDVSINPPITSFPFWSPPARFAKFTTRK